MTTFTTIKKQEIFSKVFNKGKSFHSSYFVLFFLEDSSCCEVGFVASKKVGNSVKRNFAKRRLRAIFRNKQEQLANGYYVLVAKSAIINAKFQNINNKFGYAIKKLNKR